MTTQDSNPTPNPAAQKPQPGLMDGVMTLIRWLGANPVLVCLIALAIASMGYLYWKALLWWYYEWTAEGSYYAHGVFIPFFVAAMLWRDREKLRRITVTRSWAGLGLIALALLLVIYAYRADVTVTLSISFMLFLVGATYVVAGRRITHAIIFPLLFLLTMIPIFPNQVINQAAFPIQLGSAKMAAGALSVMGFGAQRTGTQIKMDDYTLNVEVPCSGFKTLVGMMSFAGAFAYLVEAARWKRWLLFLISIPLAVLVNGVRITLIGVVGALFGSAAASTFHDWSGFIVLIVGFTFLFSMAKQLKCERFLNIPITDTPTELSTVQTPEQLDATYGAVQTGSPRRLAAGLIPVLVVLALGCGMRAVTHPLATKMQLLAASDVPKTLPGNVWLQLGDDTPITEDVRNVLQPDAYVDRTYVANPPHTGAINLFITGGKSRRTFHDPHECFVGSGYIMHDVGVTPIQTAAGTVNVQETIAENGKTGDKSLLMYLYLIDGKQTQTMAKAHLRIFMQSLFGSKTYPFYFVRFRQMANGADAARREELISFIQATWPVIKPKVQPAQAERD